MYTPRTIEQIQAQIIAKLSSYPLLSPLLPNTSTVAKFTNWTYIVAFAINALENIWAILLQDIEDVIASGAPETAKWIQDQALKFQYEASNPQVAIIKPDFSVGYPIVNTALRIITKCSVVGNGAGGILIKVTTDAGPLSGPQLTAFTSYMDIILGPDINFQIINANADIIAVYAEVYFDGQYSGSIENDIETILKNYLANLPFNGIVKLSEISDTVKKITGVTDFVFTSVIATPDGGTGINMVIAKTWQLREYTTNAGYIINDGGNPFSTTLTYIIDVN